MNTSLSSSLLFLIGLGSVTQFHFVGSIGVSELPIFLVAPIIFVMDFGRLRRDGFMPFIWLTILCCVGCCISSYVNRTPQIFFIKGLATPYSIFAATVVLHRLLRENLAGYKWLLIGAFLSSIICVFVFQPENYTVRGGEVVTGEAAIDAVTSSSLFWSTRIRGLLLLPTQAYYLSTPSVCSILAMLLSALIYILFSEGSGRAAALTTLVAMVFIILGGKSRRKLYAMRKSFGRILLIIVVSVIAMKIAYSAAAKTGLLGYDAQQKYYNQTRTGSDALHLLMAGRMEFFCGTMACLDRPIIGFGPKAEDTGGYVAKYLEKFGSPEDYSAYIRLMLYLGKKGEGFYQMIPAHSYIVSFWLCYGIVGLIVWVYVIWLFFAAFKRGWISAVPQWYGYLMLSMASEAWNILFSPYTARIMVPMLISCILFAKLIKEGRMQLPYDMEMAARKYDI